MRAVAIKKDQTRDEAIGDFQVMGILRCDACGDDFVICHSPSFVDKSVADRQAYWLEKVLAEEHERDKKHAGNNKAFQWRRLTNRHFNRRYWDGVQNRIPAFQIVR